MGLAYRIIKEKYAADAFDGEGAFRYGGRWNSPRARMVYTSATRSLAALEILVHLNPPAPLRFVVISIQFDDALVETLDLAGLPADWKSEPPGPASMAIGDDWLRNARTAILAAPSAIVPQECNYLLNPAHTDFAKIIIGTPEVFVFDPRLPRP